jgi:membrane peptidoglycan carboxypeptidase
MGYQNQTLETAKTFAQHPVHGRSSVTGGSFPAQIWQAFMRDALRDVPITEFSEPAPIEAVPDAVQIRARRGFAPGSRMYPRRAPGEVYVEDVPAPEADAPTTTTTTTEPPSTTTLLPGETTTTTRRGGFVN